MFWIFCFVFGFGLRFWDRVRANHEDFFFWYVTIAESAVYFPGGASCKGFPIRRFVGHMQLRVDCLVGWFFRLFLRDARKNLVPSPILQCGIFPLLVEM